MGRRPSLVVGANAGRSRSHNRQVVLGQIRAAGAIGRAEIARATGLSTQAVSNIIADLEAGGLIRATGRRAGGRGHPALLYALKPDGGFALGAEIRPDALHVALLDLDGRTLFSTRRALAATTPDRIGMMLAKLRDTALAEAGIAAARLLGAGVVMPGPFGRTGVAGAGSELAGWQDIDAEQVFAQALGLPVIVENDANAAAVAERVSGVARDLETFAFLYFGAGLGLGILSEGRLERGAFGNAGEIGHIPVTTPDGPVALEDRVSRLSVRAHLQRAGITVESVDDLSRLYRDRQPDLMAWLAAAVGPLGHAVQIVENLFDPETVILGGAMPDPLLDHLIEATPLSARSVADRPNRTVPRLLRGGSGRSTATLGAAALVINQTFTPEIAAAAE